MSQEAEPLTRRKFIELSCVVLKEVLQPAILKPAILRVATELEIPDASSFVAGLLAVEQKPAKVHACIWFNVFVAWFSDFKNNYGRHPVISQLIADNPGASSLALFHAFSRTVSPEAKVGTQLFMAVPALPNVSHMCQAFEKY